MSGGAGDQRIAIEGEHLRLLPERAVFREERRVLLVADTHWGKAASFRAGGIPVPGGTTLAGLIRLDAVLARTGAREVVFLGAAPGEGDLARDVARPRRVIEEAAGVEAARRRVEGVGERGSRLLREAERAGRAPGFRPHVEIGVDADAAVGDEPVGVTLERHGAEAAERGDRCGREDGGEVRDPMPFKVITGRDNLAANGLTVPGVEGMIWSGTADIECDDYNAYNAPP